MSLVLGSESSKGLRGKIRFHSTNVNAMVQEKILMKRIEYIQAKKQMEQFSSFLPDEILKFRRWSMSEVQQFVGVLLLIDISDITRITERCYQEGLGELYKMTTHINCYIGSIIETLMFYGGDVMSVFATEFLTLWKVRAEESMCDILHNVVVCGNVIQKLLGHYTSSITMTFKLRIAISCGNISLGFIGQEENRKSIIVGDAINSLRLTDTHKVYGDVFVSPGAWSHMMQVRYVTETIDFGFVKINRIAYKSNELKKKAYYDARLLSITNLIEKHMRYRDLLLNSRKVERNITYYKLHQEFIKMLPLRSEIKIAPKYWLVEDMKSLITELVFTQITESQPVEYLTEMREVTVLYINILPSSTNEIEIIHMVDKCYKIISNHLKGKLTVINNVYMAENGIWFKVLFGLRAINHENESLNALKASSAIKAEIEVLPEIIYISFGISNGLNFCSVLGHPYRKEYTIMGKSVFRARYFAEVFSEKIVCDYHIFLTSKLASFYFKRIELPKPNRASSTDPMLHTTLFRELVIFEFNEKFDVPELPHSSTELIGRSYYFNLIVDMIEDPQKVGYSGICLHGNAMMGKSAIVNKIRRILIERDDTITISIILHEKYNIPYYAVSRIHSKLYDEIGRIFNENLPDIHDLPKYLLDYHTDDDSFIPPEEMPLIKYNAIQNFRDLINSTNNLIVIIVDDAQFIDLQSWEVLEAVMPRQNLRLILTADMSHPNWAVNYKIHSHEEIKIKELLPLKEECLGPLICQFMNVDAIPLKLLQLLASSCQCIPGKIEVCLLRLISTESVMLNIADNKQIDTKKYFYKNLDEFKKNPHALSVLDFNDAKYKMKKDELTLDLISLDLFDCLTPFQQLILKTSALIGSLFTRNMLMVAMNYPNEVSLAESIKILFDEEILECGSRYFYTTHMDNARKCCRCYFEEDFFLNNARILPRYAYCKIMHFRNYNLFQVAYHRIPSNQRKELHTLCARVIEKSEHICPRCLRDPTSSFILFLKFDEIMEYCTDKNKQFDLHILERASCSYFNETVRLQIDEVKEDKPYQIIKEFPLPIERTIDNCNCLEILAYVYKEIIYHTKRSGERAKQSFFTMKLGSILLFMKDSKSAINYLTESRELCLYKIDSMMYTINDDFKRFVVGRSSISIAACYLKMRRVTMAKNYMYIALRQYNIPMVSLTCRFLRPIFTKSLVVNVRTLRPLKFKYILKRWELGLIMSVCAKIFSKEGDWKVAKQCIAHSIYMLRSVNLNMPILIDGYCTAIDLHRKYGEITTCKKLLKYAARECQVRFALDNTYYLVAVIGFLITAFELEAVLMRDLRMTIRKGYRVMHFIRSTRFIPINPDLVVNLCELSLLTCEFTDFIDNLRFLRSILKLKHKRKSLLYYKVCMYCFIYTGFYVVPLDEIINFAEIYFKGKSEHDGYDVSLKLLIQLEYLRQSRFDKAAKWEHTVNFNELHYNAGVALRIIIIYMEINLHKYCRYKKNRHVDLLQEQKENIKLLFAILHKHTKSCYLYKIYIMIYKAWFLRINGNFGSKARRLLKKSQVLSAKIGSTYLVCYIQQLINYWNGGFVYAYNSRPDVHILYASSYDLEKFTQFLHPFIDY